MGIWQLWVGSWSRQGEIKVHFSPSNEYAVQATKRLGLRKATQPTSLPRFLCKSFFVFVFKERIGKKVASSLLSQAPILSPPHLGVIIQVPEIQSAHPVDAGEERGVHGGPHDVVDIVGIVFKGVERLVVLQKGGQKSRGEGQEDFVALLPPRAVWRV